jgi:thiamine-monophosphate kinase
VEYARIPKCRAFEGLNNPELEKDCVLSGGDDYELVFTAPRGHRPELEALARELRLGLTPIGTIHPGDARLAVLDAQGKPLEPRGGFDHFAAP